LASDEEAFRSMNPQVVIRSETDADVAAFKTVEISNHTEQFIIAALRAAKALTVSLVAESGGRVVGHVAFSPVTISDGTRNWYGLGPVSVLPAYQRQGIGKWEGVRSRNNTFYLLGYSHGKTFTN
jgi:putative acetyltransferase